MSEKAHPEEPNATFLHQETSPTAATVGNKLFPESGEQTYRVLTTAGTCDVRATTGDEAAAAALVRFPGAKVGHVAPAPQQKAA
jgi:hypothetical protein